MHFADPVYSAMLADIFFIRIHYIFYLNDQLSSKKKFFRTFFRKLNFSFVTFYQKKPNWQFYFENENLYFENVSTLL